MKADLRLPLGITCITFACLVTAAYYQKDAVIADVRDERGKTIYSVTARNTSVGTIIVAAFILITSAIIAVIPLLSQMTAAP